MKTRFILIAFLLVFVIVLGACAPAEEAAPVEEAAPAEEEAPAEEVAAEATTYLVGYMAPNTAEGQIMFMDSFVRYAEAAGMEVATVNADSDVTKQDTQCTDLIAQGVNAIVMVPVDSQAIVACVDRATEAGVPVFGIDRQPFSADTVMTVMSNNYMAGEQGAECVAERLTEKYGEPKGKVIEVTGDLGTNVAQLRGNGFNDKMKDYPNIEVTTLPTDWMPETGANVVQDAFAADPTIDAIYWHSDFTGAGIIPALDEIGFLTKVGEEGHVFICGIDGDPNSLLNMAEGWQDATVNQPMLDFGVLANFVKKYLDGEELTAGVYEEEGMKWSPANIEETEYGLTMSLATWLITADDVDDPTLWGNYGK